LAVKEIGAPLKTTQKPGSKTPVVPASELEKIGVKILTFSTQAHLAAGKAIWDLMQEIKRTGTDEAFYDRYMSVDQREALVGTPAYQELQRRFLVHPE